MNWLKAIRLPNLIIVAITQIIVKYGLINPYFKETDQVLFSDKQFILLVISTVCLALFAFLINDYFDHELDRISDRKSKANFDKKMYWNSAILVVILGFSIALFLGFDSHLLHLIWIYPLSCLILYYYSRKLKSEGLAGNIVVALFTGFVIYIVMLAESNIVFQKHNDLFVILMSFIIFSFLINLYREIIKDLEDMNEDNQLNHRTLPLKIGKEKANLVALFIGGFLAILVILFGFSFTHASTQIVHIFLGIVVPLFFVLFLNFKAKSTQDFHTISTGLKLIMVIGLLYLIHAL